MVEHQQELQADIAMMQRDLQQAGDDAYFKRWLQEQHRLRQVEAEFDPLEFFLMLWPPPRHPRPAAAK
ncbi:MAG: hypothetical protein IPH37_14050 [Burkholderiales bacterium]|nr:hypothetical protein [Burkholderiales bacterium]